MIYASSFWLSNTFCGLIFGMHVYVRMYMYVGCVQSVFICVQLLDVDVDVI